MGCRNKTHARTQIYMYVICTHKYTRYLNTHTHKERERESQERTIHRTEGRKQLQTSSSVIPSITSMGSITLPSVLDIFLPVLSRTKGCKNTCSCLQCKNKSTLTRRRNCIQIHKHIHTHSYSHAHAHANMNKQTRTCTCTYIHKQHAPHNRAKKNPTNCKPYGRELCPSVEDSSSPFLRPRRREYQIRSPATGKMWFRIARDQEGCGPRNFHRSHETFRNVQERTLTSPGKKCSNSGVSSGHPNPEKGNSPDENHVSNTSGSCVIERESLAQENAAAAASRASSSDRATNHHF